MQRDRHAENRRVFQHWSEVFVKQWARGGASVFGTGKNADDFACFERAADRCGRGGRGLDAPIVRHQNRAKPLGEHCAPQRVRFGCFMDEPHGSFARSGDEWPVEPTHRIRDQETRTLARYSCASDVTHLVSREPRKPDQKTQNELGVRCEQVEGHPDIERCQHDE